MQESWKFQTVGDIVESTKGSIVTGPFGSSIGRKYWSDSGVPVIRGNNIGFDGPKFIDNNFIFISEEYYHDKMRRYTSIKDDIIFTAAGTIGQVGIIPENTKYPFYIVSNKQMRLRVNNRIVDPKFAYFYFRSTKIRELITANNTGSTIPLINLTVLKNLPFPILSFSEQNAIASILSALDDKIELNLQMNRTLEEMATTLYKHWFVDFGPFQNGKFVESELGIIPEGWEVKSINWFGKVICGKTPSKKDESNFCSDGGFQFIKIPDMHGKVFVHETVEMVSEKGNKLQLNKLLPPGSINVSCIATVGLVTINSLPAHTNQQINSIIPEKSIFRYYLYSLMLNLKERFLNEASGGSATLNMNTSTFSSIEILKPLDAELENFHLTVVNLFEQINQNSIENQTLTSLRDALLPKLISGQIRVKDAEQMLSASL